MLIRIEDIKDLCSKILAAVDTSELSQITDTLQLKTDGNCLFLSVTNHEYFAQVKFEMNEPISLDATVNANLFLKLIANTTSDVVEFKTSDKSLIIKANGTYRLPLIFDGDKLLELPTIDINNVTSSFKIGSDKLQSILNYNSKELQSGTITRPIQKLYYIDDKGAITFNTGACVNNFTLDKPIKILLNNKIVKLFKLFKTGDINFSLGHDALDNGTIQTKVRFDDDTTSITAILSCDDTLLNSVPVKSIRDIANTTYDYSVNINRVALLDSLKRLTLFTDKQYKPWINLNFKSDAVTISDADNTNSEDVFYDNRDDLDCDYSAKLNISDLRITLENCSEQYVSINFGNHRAFVVARGNISNIIPEII